MQEKKKNDITFVGSHVVFKKFTWVKKKNDIAHLQGLKWLFLLTWEMKKMVLHIYKVASDFLLHIGEENE